MAGDGPVTPDRQYWRGVPEQTGVLVIRVWFEDALSPRLRGRITRTSDVTRRDEVSTATWSAQEIKEVVQTWLRDFERSAQASG